MYSQSWRSLIDRFVKVGNCVAVTLVLVIVYQAHGPSKPLLKIYIYTPFKNIHENSLFGPYERKGGFFTVELVLKNRKLSFLNVPWN
jgi:hypothetical protein